MSWSKRWGIREYTKWYWVFLCSSHTWKPPKLTPLTVATKFYFRIIQLAFLSIFRCLCLSPQILLISISCLTQVDVTFLASDASYQTLVFVHENRWTSLWRWAHFVFQIHAPSSLPVISLSSLLRHNIPARGSDWCVSRYGDFLLGRNANRDNFWVCIDAWIPAVSDLSLYRPDHSRLYEGSSSVCISGTSASRKSTRFVDLWNPGVDTTFLGGSTVPLLC